MKLIDKLSKLLLAPPVKGTRALYYGVALIAVPTAIRFLLGYITDQLPFFPYIPFVIIAAIVLDWRYASGVAFVSWLVADLFFIETKYQIDFGPYEIVGFSIFLVSAALLIALAEAVRRVVENSLRPARPDGLSAPVVFSLEGGHAWASWYGSHSWVRLGPEEDVAEMMQDFLAQRELGKRFDGLN